MVYGARLERGFTRKGIEGSNPSLSARKKKLKVYLGLLLSSEAESGVIRSLASGSLNSLIPQR